MSSVTAAATVRAGWSRNRCGEAQANAQPQSHQRLTAPLREDTQWQGALAPEQMSVPFLTCVQGRSVG